MTINYPNTTTPMLVIQDDGSIYYYNSDGNKTIGFEQNRTIFYDTNNSIVLEVQAEAANMQVTVGNGATVIYVSKEDGSINITAPTINLNGDVKINGTLTSI